MRFARDISTREIHFSAKSTDPQIEDEGVTMKAIMINSKEKSVHYVDLSTNSESRMSEMHDRLECSTFTIGATYPNGDVLFVDDEGLLSLTDESMFFRLDSFQMLAGNGILVGPEIEFNNGTWTVKDVETLIEDIRVTFHKYTELNPRPRPFMEVIDFPEDWGE